MKENPLTIHLWLISTYPPHYELIPTTPTVLKSSKSFDGYVTDEELYTQLESDTQDIILESSIYVRTDEQYWKKTGVRG